MTLKITKQSIICLIMAVLMFSATSLYTTETLNLYVVITAFCLLITFFLAIRNLSNLSRIFTKGFIAWLTILYVFIFLQAFFRTRSGVFNYRYTFFSWVTLIMMWYLLYSINRKEDVINILCEAAEIASMAVCIYILIRERNLILIGGTRIGESLSGNTNTVGIQLSIYALCILFRALKTKNKFHYIPLGITVVFALLTGSKKVVIYLFFGAWLYLWYNRFKVSRMVIFAIVASILIYEIFNNSILYSIIGYRIVDFFGSIGLNVSSYSSSFSTNERAELIEIGWEYFMSKPIFGGGYNVVSTLNIYNYYAHNNFIELLADYGIIGFTLYYSIYIKYIWSSFKYRNYFREDFCFLEILILSLLAKDYAAVSYLGGPMSYICVLVVGVYLSKQKEERKNASPKIKNIK